MKRILTLFVLMIVIALLGACKAQSKEDMYQEGLALKEAGNLSGAVVLFRNALEKDPNFTDARYELGKIFYDTERYQRAENEFTKVALQEPTRADVALDLIRTLLASEKYEEAETRLSAYQSRHPEDAEGWTLFAQLYGLTDRYEESYNAYQKALQYDSAHPEAPLGLATLLMAQNRHDEARKILQRAIEQGVVDPVRAHYLLARMARAEQDLDTFQGLLEKILTYDNSDLSANYQLGLIALENNEPQEALKYARKLVRHHEDRPEGYQLEGFALFQEEQYSAAIPKLQESLRRGEHFQTHFYLAMSYFHSDNFELAINHFNRVLDAEPNIVQARVMLATTLLRQGRSSAAAIEAHRAVQAAPYSAHARNLLGSAYVMEGKYAEAMVEFDRATLLDPEMSSVHLKKGLLGLQKGDIDEASADLLEAVAANPDALESRLLLAEVYLREGRLDDSYAQLEAGLKGSARDALLLNRMAYLKMRQGAMEQGLDLLRRAKEVSPEYRASYLNLASYYQASGRPQEALQELDALVEIAPDFVPARLNRAALLEGLRQFDRAEGDLKKAVEAGDSQAFHAYAGYLARRGQVNNALNIVKRGLDAHPEDAALLEGAGRLSIGTRNHLDAIGYFEQLSQVDPDKGSSMLAGAYVAAGQQQRAIDLAQEIIAKEPKAPRGHLLLAAIQQQTGDLTAAHQVLDEGLRQTNSAPGLLLMKGALYERQGENAKALAAYESGLKGSEQPQANLLFAKAALLHRTDQTTQAVEYYQRALQANPNLTPAMNNLAYLYLKTEGRKEEGLQLALRAYQAAPLDPAIQDTLGYALHQNGQLESARRVLESAANRLAGHPTVHYHLAAVYYDLGEQALAVEQLNRALQSQSFPELAQAQELLNRIEQAQ
jgi:putative PEP-CTERM system TPR-repeat lipoprotein